MDKPKTITQYIELLKVIDSVDIIKLEGFNKEEKSVRDDLQYLADSISDQLAYIFLNRI